MNKETTTSTQTTPDNRPLWQQISGIDPQTESEMSRAERNAALRKLITEVTARAEVEFADEDDGDIPDGERTIFWDPMHRVCMQLGISRTKLSAYSRELTGMRAHEISDRIKAKRTLKARLQERIEWYLRSMAQDLRQEFVRGEILFEQLGGETRSMVQLLKSRRKFERAASFAVQMGFANSSRLNRACLLAFGKSLDQLESEMVCTYVQKFFEGLDHEQNLTQSRKGAKEQPRKEQNKEGAKLTSQAEDVIRDAVAHTLGIKKEEVRVA